MKEPRIGELDTRIEIKDWDDVPNDDAGIDQNFSNPIKVWAKREPVGAGIYQGSMQLSETITDRFIIRYRTDVKKGKSIWIGTVRFLVVRAAPLAGGKRWLVIEVEELGEYA